MSVAAIDHPFFTGLVGDEETAALFSIHRETAALLQFEIALAEAQAKLGIIPTHSAPAIKTDLAGFTLDIATTREGIAQDGVIVPTLLKQMRSQIRDEARSHLHFGATSQDVIDTGLALRLVDAVAILERRLYSVIAAFEALRERDGDLEVMAHTRMQAAIPVKANRKIRSWHDPLVRELEQLQSIKAAIAILHFGGAAGTLEKFGDKGPALTQELARLLDLGCAPAPRHTERDGIVAFASVLSLISGSLGKFGQDVALMAQSEMKEINLASGGGSSAMPHKKNPVPAEILVTLARFNATLISGMHQSMVHENERSGAAWTLEWMILPQMVVTTAAALRHAESLAKGISFNGMNE